jgi:hypothetical protein
MVNGEPNKTLFEPPTSNLPEKRLLDLLVEHYDELDRLIALDSHRRANEELASRKETERPA